MFLKRGTEQSYRLIDIERETATFSFFYRIGLSAAEGLRYNSDSTRQADYLRERHLGTMNETVANKALRMRKDRDYEGKPKRYEHTYRLVPEGSDEFLFSCDVIGHLTTHEISFVDGRNTPAFSMRPNRKMMPTKWPVKDSSGRDIGLINLLLLGKGAWAGLDASGMEVFRLIDAESRVERVGNSLFGGFSSKYGMFQGDRLIATTNKEPRKKTTKKGLRGFLQAFAIPSDWVIRFSADAPDMDLRLVFPAMVLLIDYTVAMDAAD